jgi:enhancing lycopene biosynthesis protein 2
MNKKFLVVLAGCGAKDGAEIHEAVLTLLALEEEGAEYQCAAPNILQKHVLNFIDDSEINQERNVMIEAARIARGKIIDLSKVSMDDYAGLILPGGFGVAKNLCSFAFDGADATVNPDAKRIIQECYKQNKPIAAICIAPALVALSLAALNPEITLTLGTDEGMNTVLEDIGVRSKSCLTTSFIVDEKNKITSSPAYMHGKSKISELREGISKCIKTAVEMARTKA